MCASGVKNSELEQKVNIYLMEMSRYLWENLLLILAPKSSVTLFTPDRVPYITCRRIKVADSELPLVCSPKTLGVYIDSSNDSRLHVVEPPRERSFIWQIRVVVVYPLPWPLLVGGVRCSRLWSTSQLLRPSGQQCSHSGGVCPQIQGRQCGAYVGAVEEMMCVVCVDVTEGA